MASRPLRRVSAWRSSFSRSFLSLLILSRMIRRSVSISVSPGPRMPIPPRWRSRCVQRPRRRGSMYCIWASSTWVLAWAVWARLAKMSRIRLERSMILTFIRSSRTPVCLPLRSSSKMTIVTSSWFLTYSAISAALPLPMKVLLSGLSSFWVKRLRVLAPAVSARNSSSSRYSFTCSSVCPRLMRPTVTAYSVSFLRPDFF